MRRDLIHTTERVLTLRRIGFFRALDDQLISVVAHHTHVRMWRAGAVLFEPDEPPREMNIIVDGLVAIERDGAHIVDVSVGSAVGALSAFHMGPDTSSTARAMVDTLTLAIDHEIYVSLMEDHFELVVGPLKGMASEIIDMAQEIGGQTQLGTNRLAAQPAEPLDLVQRIFALLKGEMFQETSLEVTAAFAERLTETRYRAGETLWIQGEPSGGATMIAHGEVECSGPGWVERCYDDAWIGSLSTLAQRPRRGTAVAKTDVVALVAPSELLLDVLEDNFAMARRFLAVISGIYTQLQNGRAANRKAQQASTTAEGDAAAAAA